LSLILVVQLMVAGTALPAVESPADTPAQEAPEVVPSTPPPPSPTPAEKPPAAEAYPFTFAEGAGGIAGELALAIAGGFVGNLLSDANAPSGLFLPKPPIVVGFLLGAGLGAGLGVSITAALMHIPGNAGIAIFTALISLPVAVLGLVLGPVGPLIPVLAAMFGYRSVLHKTPKRLAPRVAPTVMITPGGGMIGAAGIF